VVADLSNIEGRVLAWVAGEEWKLKAYRAYDQGTGPDLYLVTAGNILRKPPEAVTKSERQDYGKVPELACGYQGGVGAFHTMGQLYGLELTDAEALAIVKGWRAANPNIVKLWYALEDTAKRAIANPGRVFRCGRLIMKRSGAWFRIALPSGRELCYANPRIADKQIFYEGLNTYTRRWEQLTTYGGKLAENIVQATARDVLAGRMPAIEEAGYRIVLSVHDEILTEVPDTKEYSAADLCQLMTTGLDWTEGLPLAAEGFEARRYRK
jgi:DNA polymerase